MRRTAIILVLLALAVTPWLIGSRYVFHIATMVVIMAPMAMSLNIMIRFGQLSLAQTAFMGLASYCAALLSIHLAVPPVLAILCGAVAVSLLALSCGLVFLRIKGVFFALLTFAFGQIVNLLFQEWVSVFGGNSGLYGIPKLSILGFRFTQAQHFYLLGIVITAFCCLTLYLIDRSVIGRTARTLEENEPLAQSFGSHAMSWRLLGFTIAAFMAGLSGGVYAFYIGFLSPDAFTFALSVDLILINVVGGVGSVLGPLIGALIVVPLPELLRGAEQYQMLLYGAFLIVFLLFFRDGISGMLRTDKSKP